MSDLTGLRGAGEHVVLRPLALDDEAAFVALVSSSVDYWAPWTPSRSPRIPLRERFRRERTRAELGAVAGTHLRLGGFLADGTLIGLFALNEIVRGALQSGHASWQIGVDWAGRGLGTDGGRALLDIAFGSEPAGAALHRVQANIMPENAASLRVAEKLGFRREGLAKGYLRIAGAWADHTMWALTADEWLEGR